MQCRQMIFLFVIVLYSDLACQGIDVPHTFIRDKRQEGPWYWGENKGQLNDQSSTTVPPAPETTPDKNDPCSPYEPIKPDFYKGRRISEAKCYEYIWEVKNREEINERAQACRDYLSSLIPNGIHIQAIGGRNTIPGEFPHMGALGWRAVIGTWIFKCGSSLITSKFLLTAAHCSQVSSADTTVANTRPEIVRLGDKNIIDKFANGQKPKDAKILRIIVHPQYKAPKKYFDIAIIEITDEVTFSKYIHPACLWTKHDLRPLGNKASLTGWGTVDAAKQEISPELQAAEVDLIDSNFCNELLKPAFNRHFNGIQSHQLCAGVLRGGVDSCQGDSGGPLQVKIDLPIKSAGNMSYIIGVTSFGLGCARVNKPGVYTRVSSFIDWIEDIVWR